MNNIEPICPKCGRRFTCGISAGESTCWCFSSPRLMKIEGTECLCPDCLAKAIESERSGTSDAPVRNV